MFRGLFKRRAKKKAHWNVYNAFEPIEFAECTNCGHEIDWIEDGGAALSPDGYPDICPGCGAKMEGSVFASGSFVEEGISEMETTTEAR